MLHNKLSDWRDFLHTKVQALKSRARRLSKLTPHRVGLRAEDIPFAPSPAHFKAVNDRLQVIDRSILQRLKKLDARDTFESPQKTLQQIAYVEREVDRARRAFGMFFEVFSQRGTTFAPALAAHDVIAVDCYAAIRKAAPEIFKGRILKPLTYMEHGYSPATMRRGVSLIRLLGEKNPFPIIRIPWDRDNPWQSVFLHEVSHNLQADLGIWQENKDAVGKRILNGFGNPQLVSIYSRWHKEIFADLAAILLGGTASAWGMMEFLTHPHPKVTTYKPGGAHPTGYFRVLILAEMLDRLGFGEEAVRMRGIWRRLYDLRSGYRVPATLMRSSNRVIPAVVDEIAFQTRRNLAQRALADVIPFTRANEYSIRQGAAQLLRGKVPRELSPRFLVSASRHALHAGADLPRLSRLVITHLAASFDSKRQFVMPQDLAA
ncbi:hypothetical protein SAMN05216302_100991 [Nitrosomonas aestuarii]|uniref:Uncharacterized protein n=1 Tax=Nitrosomonas aestuarii TaxID=52441 RepID=A0A1I4AM01_9PROT|nr:hypothetical protein [Nitrosomonas aestuarii]SFK57230.1 hypothetical protein SAMN05216302_100991 [Nitrosomonas aestuarii]